MHLFADVYLACFYTFVAVFYTCIIKYRAKRATRGPLVHMGAPCNAHWWNHLLFRVMRILIWLFCIFRLLLPELDRLAYMFPASEWIELRIVGLVILSTGFLIVVYTNLKLSTSWRSGIDTSNPTDLKQDGPYRFSRNPIYIGVVIGQVGFFAALPSAFTLFCLVVGFMSINLQIHLEEAHLKKRLKLVYTDYCKRVPRWI